MPDEQVMPKFEPKKYRYLRNRLQLDLMAIDEELMDISVLIQEACECAAMANESLTNAKDVLSYTKAAAAARLRSTTEGKAPSETQITGQLNLDKEVQEQQSIYASAELDARLWQSIADSLKTKSFSIRVAADLINSGYLTSDKIRVKQRQAIREAGPAA